MDLDDHPVAVVPDLADRQIDRALPIQTYSFTGEVMVQFLA